VSIHNGCTRPPAAAIGRGPTLADLVQEGALGLLNAVQRFDYRKRYRFSTYAAWVVRGAIVAALKNTSPTLRLPDDALSRVTAIAAAELRLEQRLGRRPSLSAVAEEVQLAPERVRQLRTAAQPPLSLDAPLSEEDGVTLGELLEDRVSPSPHDLALAHFQRTTLHRAVEELPPRKRSVIEQRFGLKDGEPRTLAEIGRSMGVTHEWIRQLEAAVCGA
jgi:RNA polymerase primary sigma factor